MALRDVSRDDFRVTGAILVLCSAAGALYQFVAEDFVLGARVARGFLVGATIALLNATFEISLTYSQPGERLRRASFPVHVLVKTLVYGAVFAFSLVFWDAVFERQSIAEILAEDYFLPVFLGCFAMGFLINFLLLAHFRLGPRVLLDFVTGRYHRPRQEERVILVLDIIGSTALARRLGELRYLDLLDRFFSGIAQPVRATGGEIHKYVGDAVVITWERDRGLRNAACVRCWLGVLERLEERRESWESDFGAVPGIRAALHAGPVVVGEIGDLRQELAMVGETVNLVARIEEVAKDRGEEFVATAEILDPATLPDGVECVPLEPLAAKGSDRLVPLMALRRASGSGDELRLVESASR